MSRIKTVLGSLRGYGTRVILFSLLIAGVHFQIQSVMGRYADERRVDQLKFAHIGANLNRLVGNLDGASLGEEIEGFDRLDSEIRTDLAMLDRDGHHHDLRAFEKEYDEFLAASTRQLALVHQGRLKEAADYDLKVTDALYAEAEAMLDRYSVEAGDAAIQWRTLASNVALASLTISVLFVTLIMARFYRTSVAVTTSETMRTAAESNERRFKALVSSNSDIIALVDPDGTIKLVSDACNEGWNGPPEKFIGSQVQAWLHESDVPSIVAQLKQAELSGAREMVNDLQVSIGEDLYRPFRVTMTNLTDNPDVGGILLTFHDLTDQKKFEKELTHQAFHDALTGLPNRALFLDRLEQRLHVAQREKLFVAVMFLDLDNFKNINDSLGHDAGDQLLIQVAERVRRILRPGDTFARLGGDEFTVLLEGVGSIDEATVTAQRMIEALEMPFSILDRQVFATASLGIAISTGRGEDANCLLRDADTAMYQAKNNGKSSYVVFDRSMNAAAIERLELEADLRMAIDKNEFVLHYQPIVDIVTSDLREVEALVRWQHPTRGLIPPLKFIPIAEETGLILALGNWVMEQACGQLAEWKTSFPAYENLVLSVNVSSLQFQQPGFVGRVAQILENAGLKGSSLKIEITESLMLTNLDASKRVMEDLRALGIAIAIDDFGTGYSSMSYLSRLPIDTLKIDRAFVEMVGKEGPSDGIVRAIISMARSLGMSVTSEGIETATQLEALEQFGCDLGQGFLFAKPMSVNALTQFLASDEDGEMFKHAA